jgi:hypothetical protein
MREIYAEGPLVNFAPTASAPAAGAAPATAAPTSSPVMPPTASAVETLAPNVEALLTPAGSP